MKMINRKMSEFQQNNEMQNKKIRKCSINKMTIHRQFTLSKLGCHYHCVPLLCFYFC